MTNTPINIQIPTIELKDAVLVIDLLSKQKQNTTFLIPLANSVLEQINKSYFEIGEIDIFRYAKYITKLENIIPIEPVLNNLSEIHKEKLYGPKTHNKITNILNKISLNYNDNQNTILKIRSNEQQEKLYNLEAWKELTNTLQHEKIQKNKTIAIIENGAKLSKFSFSKYIDELLTPLLKAENVPQLLKQLTFINYINNNLTNKQSNNNIYFTKNFVAALKDEKFLINFLPSINPIVYTIISSAINYDVTKLSKNNVQTYLDKIIKNKTTHLIEKQFFIDLINYHIKKPEDINLKGLSVNQCLNLEKVAPLILPSDVYQRFISHYLMDNPSKKYDGPNYDKQIKTLLTTFNGRKNLVLDDDIYSNIIEYITIKSTELKNKNSEHLLLIIHDLIEFVEKNTTQGTTYFANFFEQKSKFKKYNAIQPIWERLHLENKIDNTKTEKVRSLKI